MKYKFPIALLLTSTVVFACSGDSDENSDSLDVVPSSTSETSGGGFAGMLAQSDAVAFKPLSSDTIMETTIDGKNVSPHPLVEKTNPDWPQKELIVSRVCGSEMGNKKRNFQFLSPSGATIDKSVDEWVPVWHPEDNFVAVACAPVDEQSDLVIVTDEQIPGDRPDWSRSGRAELSDRVNIYLISTDGSRIRNITYSEIAQQAGDWLPQWSPKGEDSPEGEFLAFESNRDGDSEIFVVNVNTGKLTQVTNNETSDQTPVWSRDGHFLVFSSDRSGTFEIYAIPQLGGSAFPIGQSGHPVPWTN